LNKSDEEELTSHHPSPTGEGVEQSCSVIPENFDKKLDEKIAESKVEKKEMIMNNKHVITIPTNAKKEDLVALKVFMQSEKP